MCKYGGAFEENFFGRQPSARGEALGRGTVALSGDILSSINNPAGLADAIGLTFCTSFSDDRYAVDRADRSFFGVGIPVGRYVGVGFSRYHLDYSTQTVHPGRRQVTYPSKSSTYTLTLAAAPAAHLYIGMNLNLLRSSAGGQDENSYYPDVGILKVFRRGGSGHTQHRVSMGGSLSNFTNSDVVTAAGDESLPVTLRIGTAYRISLAHRSWHERLRTLGLLCHLEYQDVLNSDYFDAYKIGGEVSLLELLALRTGYYYENRSEVEGNDDWVGETTYGLGFGLPIGKLRNDAPPLRISLDWVRREDPERYSVYTLCVDWFF
ncbi:MAG: hypothetical protein ABIJ00_11455 [Candidatus Eisenbacteria bacterium]